jgi:phage tail sheath gpL-like
MEADSVVGAPLVSDTTVTTNPSAIQPKTVKGWFANLANSLALKALISDQDFTKKNTVVEIDSENPKRLNVSFPVKLSGNVEVASVDVLFGFYLG